MYGWINGCLEHLVLRAFGLEVWLKIKDMAGCHQTEEILNNVNYSDESTFKLVGAASELLNQPVDALLEVFGKHFVHYLTEHGYSSTLQCQGSTVREWLKNVNEPHRLLKSRFPKSNFPEFWTLDDDTHPDSLILHYLSSRGSSLSPVVVGIACEAAKVYFSKDISFVMLETETMASGKFHCVWRVLNVGPPDALTSPRHSSNSSNQNSTSNLYPHPPTEEMRSAIATGRCPFAFTSAHSSRLLSPQQSQNKPGPNRNGRNIRESSSQLASLSTPDGTTAASCTTSVAVDDLTTAKLASIGVGMSPKTFRRVFPFHIVVDEDLKIIQVGQNLEHMLVEENITAVVGVPAHRLFSITLPDNNNHPWTWPQLLQLRDHSVELLLTFPSKKTLKFCGEIDFLEDVNNHQATKAAFLINPDLKSTQELIDSNLHLHDLPRYSFQRDLLVIGEHLKTELNNGLQLSHLSHRLQEEKKKANDALQTKRIFVRYISHEIRTPLNITVLGLRFVEEEMKANNNATLDSNHVIREVLDDVKDSCTIAVDILNDLLLYEKLDEGYFDISKSTVFLCLFIEEAARNFKLLAKSADVNFALHYQNQPDMLNDIMVDMDKTKMHQVLRNLMSNALKFTRQNGQVSMTCEVFHHGGADDSSARDDGITFADDSHDNGSKPQGNNSSPNSNNKRRISEIQQERTDPFSSFSSFSSLSFTRITVTDSGPGISPSDQLALFHEFSQVQADKLQNGQDSGLGLWIAASIMKMHGGRIGVMSEGEGHGSSFIIDLPIIVPTNSNALSTSSQEMVVDSSAPAIERSMNEAALIPAETAKRRRSLSVCSMDFTACFRRLKDCSVLIVDDVASNRKMVRRILRDKFCFFDEAENGQEAVDKFTAGLASGRVFDVVMMDFLMPVMNGLEATTRIKAAAAVASLSGSDYKPTVVVGVTGNGQENDLRAFENAGADIVFVKPLNIKRFDEFLTSKNFVLE